MIMIEQGPVALDLFCCAGGAAKGLDDAGFKVVGIDIEPQPRYPFEFIQHDAMQWLRDWLSDWPHVRRVDFIWASPPCQSHTAYRRKGHGVGDGYEDLIPEVRELLRETAVPYVIENVVGAPLENPVTLCGSMFNLDVRRHRLFECSFPVPEPECDHAAQEAKGKRYPGATNRDGRYTCEVGVWRIPIEQQHAAMGGCEWMKLEELSQAIPPAYSEHIGRAALAWLDGWESEINRSSGG